ASWELMLPCFSQRRWCRVTLWSRSAGCAPRMGTRSCFANPPVETLCALPWKTSGWTASCLHRPEMQSGRPLLAQNQQRHRGMTDQVGGGAADQPLANPGMAIGPHHGQINTLLFPVGSQGAFHFAGTNGGLHLETGSLQSLAGPVQ